MRPLAEEPISSEGIQEPIFSQAFEKFFLSPSEGLWKDTYFEIYKDFLIAKFWLGPLRGSRASQLSATKINKDLGADGIVT